MLLVPVLGQAFAGDRFSSVISRLPRIVQLTLPALAAIPYWLVAHSTSYFRWSFVAIYAGLPVIIVALLWSAAQQHTQQCGNWRDFTVLLVVGVIVEFRLLEPAWPPHMGFFNRLILLETGLYGFLAIRQLRNVGFNFAPRLGDVKYGLRELAYYALIAIPLGLRLGFLHFHGYLPSLGNLVYQWISIFAFIAVLEETYFRGWLQNLLERRFGRNWSLLVTAMVFGLSHFNKGAMYFNWRYVLMASLAGIFYGRAWRQEHRLVASAITHASVDTIWSVWLR
jgi:membrane protease YdiL (CAAX protease family)